MNNLTEKKNHRAVEGTHSMITKKQNGVYLVKPSLLMKGDDDKKHRLLIEYETVKKENENEIKTEETENV